MFINFSALTLCFLLLLPLFGIQAQAGKDPVKIWE